MTRESDEITSVSKLVVTMDMCSSTHIIDQLLTRNEIMPWRNVIIGMKEFLREALHKTGLSLYNFTGDGWILLADSFSGKRLFETLSKVNLAFEDKYANEVAPHLDTPPPVRGMTFGLDEGPLIRIVMNRKPEYVGRPINVACRLQGKVSQVDINGGFRGLMSNRLYHRLKDELHVLEGYEFRYTERSLKNLSIGDTFGCYLFALPSRQFRITRATYGTPNNTVDVTLQYVRKVQNEKLNVVVSNDVAGGDPHYGVQKTLEIEYSHEGGKVQRMFTEGTLIQLP